MHGVSNNFAIVRVSRKLKTFTEISMYCYFECSIIKDTRSFKNTLLVYFCYVSGSLTTNSQAIYNFV